MCWNQFWAILRACHFGSQNKPQVTVCLPNTENQTFFCYELRSVATGKTDTGYESCSVAMVCLPNPGYWLGGTAP